MIKCVRFFFCVVDWCFFFLEKLKLLLEEWGNMWVSNLHFCVWSLLLFLHPEFYCVCYYCAQANVIVCGLLLLLSFFLPFLCVCVSVCFCYAHILRTHKAFFLPTCLPCGKLVAAAVALALLFLLVFLSSLAPDLFFLRCLLLILVTFLLLLLPPAAATSLLLLLLLGLSSPSCPPPPPRPSPVLVSSVCPILEIGFSGHAITPPGESVGRRVGSRERSCRSLFEESGTRERKLVFVWPRMWTWSSSSCSTTRRQRLLSKSSILAGFIGYEPFALPLSAFSSHDALECHQPLLVETVDTKQATRV